MQFTLLTLELFAHLYQDISEFRFTFDLPIADLSSLDDKADTLHTSLAIEELTELAEADCKTEQADAIIDTVYVLMGRLVHRGDDSVKANIGISYIIELLLHVAKNRGVEFLPCWDEVHSSNMSKVCRSKQEFIETQAFYAKQNVELEAVKKGDYIIAKCAKDIEMQGKTVRKGKVLKSVYYRPADLESLTQ
ncbi:nucleoside triphosphate pyrophosphohydrolase family protein [Vibrio sp. S11_S32]|uniref:nucleoside triphosphate pyrophosphohydrolase family protein n=1 Tax=Vibrio sp. S11_S32 TaxID=2720225 RepID=UPI001680FB26|nr:nucleoside triphosphate pyrophosphohydrolase family protein [Vibrio sp. S11_S32]MBD1577554.1 nucleoside triphosphate pyrophosphohydrolase family protein [Vibrio sp. S11_S32]